MVQGVASEVMGCAQAVLCLLSGHHHLIQGQGVFLEPEYNRLHILRSIDFLSSSHISQARGLDQIFPRIDIAEDKGSVFSCHRPEVILAHSHHSTGYGGLLPCHKNLSGYPDAVCCSSR